jgi:hypothetical protein
MPHCVNPEVYPLAGVGCIRSEVPAVMISVPVSGIA